MSRFHKNITKVTFYSFYHVMLKVNTIVHVKDKKMTNTYIFSFYNKLFFQINLKYKWLKD